jgi:uncharacterized membrane protein
MYNGVPLSGCAIAMCCVLGVVGGILWLDACSRKQKQENNGKPYHVANEGTSHVEASMFLDAGCWIGTLVDGMSTNAVH